MSNNEINSRGIRSGSFPETIQDYDNYETATTGRIASAQQQSSVLPSAPATDDYSAQPPPQYVAQPALTEVLLPPETEGPIEPPPIYKRWPTGFLESPPNRTVHVHHSRSIRSQAAASPSRNHPESLRGHRVYRGPQARRNLRGIPEPESRWMACLSSFFPCFAYT